MTKQMVTIPKAEYDQLAKDSEFLDALKTCGVDNWEGYSDACAMMEDADD